MSVLVTCMFGEDLTKEKQVIKQTMISPLEVNTICRLLWLDLPNNIMQSIPHPNT